MEQMFCFASMLPNNFYTLYLGVFPYGDNLKKL